jgi:hypothetical protein
MRGVVWQLTYQGVNRKPNPRWTSRSRSDFVKGLSVQIQLGIATVPRL